MAINFESSFLLQYFQEFYYEVLRQKEKALRLGEVSWEGVFENTENNAEEK